MANTISNEAQVMLRMHDIHKSFGDLAVLKGIDVEVRRGEVLAIIGPSGSGKSTLLRCINKLETIDSGSIEIEGEFLADTDEHGTAEYADAAKTREILSHTGMVFQQFNLFPHMTVLENLIEAPIQVKGMKKAEILPYAKELLEKVGLADRADYYPSQLSGGQQQRVALARMLAARPGILMLDEPFSALDSHLKGVLEQNLVSLFEAFEGTILYVSHDIDESLRFCDRIAVVDAGRIVEMDRGRELVNRPQSVAGLKLSGCKNAPAAEYAGPHAVHVPPWGIDVHTAQEVPRDVKCLGLRAFYVERAEGPGENCYRVRVDRVSDARFERMALLGFLDRDDADGAAVAFETNEMSYLHQHMFWRVSMREGVALPEVGERLWVRIPPDKVYLVSR